MRCLTPVEGKKAIIIDYVNNVQRHGFPTMQREWSLSKPIKEYYNEDDTGKFIIRVCQNCFMTFETADICPYCGAVYETTPVEIENFKEIELKKIEEAKEERRQKYLSSIADKVKEYKNARECNNWVELTQFVKQKGYRPRLRLCTCTAIKNTISARKEYKMKKAKLEWYAFRYDWNSHKLVFINVLSNMEEEIIKKVKKGEKDKWRPVTNYESFKDYIKGELMYYYWSKSEHEVLIGDLSGKEDENEKHDIWWQLEPNLDRICEYIISKLDLKL